MGVFARGRTDRTASSDLPPSSQYRHPQVDYHPNALVADLEHLARNYERLAQVIQGVRNQRDPDAMYVWGLWVRLLWLA